jgi:NADPH-dependent curcumin reductase CurA
MQNIGSVLINRIKMQGFIVSDDMSRWPPALKELGGLVATGKLKYRETVADGLAAAPPPSSACSRAATSASW